MRTPLFNGHYIYFGLYLMTRVLLWWFDIYPTTLKRQCYFVILDYVPVKPIWLNDERTTVNTLMTLKKTSFNGPEIDSIYLYSILIKG